MPVVNRDLGEKKLTFARIKDEADSRAAVLTSGTWAKKE